MSDCDAVRSRILKGRNAPADEQHVATCPECRAFRLKLAAAMPASPADTLPAPPGLKLPPGSPDAPGGGAATDTARAATLPVADQAGPPADAYDATISPDTPTTSPAAASASTVDVDIRHSYELGRRIGEGGMGIVRAARDRTLGRQLALKLLKARTPEMERRFEAEARITAGLQHPSIVNVHEAGRWPTGEPYYAMKLVSGRPLDVLIGEARGLADRLALIPNVLAVADALAYAHDHKVIHRDLKPQNVMVGEFGETVVLDWGLAKDLSGAAVTTAATAAAGLDTHKPALSAGAGTAAYMPPEQAEGRTVDERADVYALGAILYQVC